MGNCMEICKSRSKIEEANVEDTSKEMKEINSNNSMNGMKVKIKLRREELEYLMSQLKDKGSGRNHIEEILNQISLQRQVQQNQTIVWKPNLDCITEIPEIQGFDN